MFGGRNQFTARPCRYPGSLAHQFIREGHPLGNPPDLAAHDHCGQKPFFASSAATLQAISTRDFSPRETIFLTLEDCQRFAVTNSSRVKVTVQKFSAHRIELDAEAVEPALVVVAQSFHKNWRARLDGKPARLLRANNTSQAAEIPAGRHHVALIYQDNFFRCGAVVSFLSAVAWIVLWLRWRKLANTPK